MSEDKKQWSPLQEMRATAEALAGRCRLYPLKPDGTWTGDIICSRKGAAEYLSRPVLYDLACCPGPDVLALEISYPEGFASMDAHDLELDVNTWSAIPAGTDGGVILFYSCPGHGIARLDGVLPGITVHGETGWLVCPVRAGNGPGTWDSPPWLTDLTELPAGWRRLLNI